MICASSWLAGYSCDSLYRDAKSRDEFILLCYWKSEEARRAAFENPEVLRCWAKLAHEIRIVRVYEILEEALTSRNDMAS
jgi:heme-degrading monooxygenase HmoA